MKNSQKKHDYLYWEFHEKGGRTAIRKGKWKGIKYDVLSHPDRTIEIYNLEEDPGETKDIAAEYPELVKELTELMAEARTPSDIFTFSAPTYLNAK